MASPTTQPPAHIAALLDSFSAVGRLWTLGYYGQPQTARAAFDIEYGLHNLHKTQASYVSGPFFTSPDPDQTLHAIKTCLIFRENARLFCHAAVPSLTRMNVGHAVAIVFDEKTRVIFYQDPYGNAPSPETLNKLQTFFPDYRIANLGISQQKDDVSCALITTMNLVALAKDTKPDPLIQDKLWDIRLRHAQPLLARAKAELISLAKSEITNTTPNLYNAGLSGFRPTVFNKTAIPEIIEAIDQRNAHHSSVPAPLRFLIAAAAEVPSVA